jgi:type II secretory pathway component PulF
MIFAYTYRSRGLDGQLGSGILYAGSAAEAHFRLRHRLVREPLSIRIDPWHTLLAWWQPEFGERDLIAFYRALGRRLERGQAIQPGLEQAQEFVSDPRLVQAIALLAHGLQEGQRIGVALRAAGFPERDAASLDAVADTGRLPDTLLMVAADLERRARLRQGLRRTMQMPLTVSALLYLGLYFAFMLFLPTMARFYAALGATSLPPMAEVLFAAAAAFRAHPVLTSAAWLCLPVLMTCLVRSRRVAGWWERIPLVHQLLERSELASLWGGFATLYDAGVQVEEACRLLQAAATRPAARRWFTALALELHAGWPLPEATVRAGFPRHVIRAVQAADSGGDLVAGLRTLADGLAEEVSDLGIRQEHLVRVVSTLVAASLVAVFFLLTYLPLLSATFSQL